MKGIQGGKQKQVKGKSKEKDEISHYMFSQTHTHTQTYTQIHMYTNIKLIEGTRANAVKTGFSHTPKTHRKNTSKPIYSPHDSRLV